MFKDLIGTRDFYKKVLLLTIPIMIQNGITNLVNMLDNIMVGRLGQVEMTGVAVSNQLIFVFNLCIFGAISGAGIFGAQFYGNEDHEGVRYTFRFKILFCTLLTVAGILILLLWGDPLISLYLKGEGSAEDAAASLNCAKEYIAVMLIGLIPYTIAQCYSSTLRETGHAFLPMLAGVIAVFVNMMLNAVLIFGLLGAPRLGVVGAAIATVISRFVEMFIVIIWTRIKSRENKFIVGAYRSLYVPRALVGKIFLKGMPLMVNEALWASGMATLNQRYSERGLDVVAANNISQTFFNVFSVAFLSVGVAIGIILGQMLGSGDNEGARRSSRQLIAFSVFISIAVSAIYAVCAEFIPLAYNTTNEVQTLATRMMQICAIAMPIDAFANATYFTLRSGGKAFITFLFDSCFVWVISVPIAFILSEFTSIGILPLYAICLFVNILKCFIGGILVHKGVWIKNIVK